MFIVFFVDIMSIHVDVHTFCLGPATATCCCNHAYVSHTRTCCTFTLGNDSFLFKLLVCLYFCVKLLFALQLVIITIWWSEYVSAQS